MVEYCESFPEVTRDIKVGLPSELLPLWHVGWTMASFDGHEVVASPTTAGQMSRNVVYKARQGDEHFAIKKYEGDANTLRTCLHEATLLVRMQHPHVAKLVGLFEDASAFHLIMPFYSHGRLDVWVRDREARLAVAVFACVLHSKKSLRLFASTGIVRSYMPLVVSSRFLTQSEHDI